MSFSRDEFLAQRVPRRGRSNPERMQVPLWEWLVANPISAYEANDKFGTPGHCYPRPGWCFQRFGCSRTELTDGRIIHIAGEHEDHYDPDFYIYNDVIVEHPEGAVTIHGYPVDVFPPTDFHSATRVGDAIYLIGSLGYPDQRRPGETPVYRLELSDLSIQPVATTGEAPGWIHDHGASHDVAENRIVIRRGVVQIDDQRLVDVIDDWALDLRTLRWTRLTRRPFQEWHVAREDGEDLMLFEMSNLAFETRYGDSIAKHMTDPEVEKLWKDLDPTAKLLESGRRFELACFESLYVPSMPHEQVYKMGDDEDDVASDDSSRNMKGDACRVRVGSALVRYGEHMDHVSLRIEGDLAADEVARLVGDLRDKLASLQGAECIATRQND